MRSDLGLVWLQLHHLAACPYEIGPEETLDGTVEAILSPSKGNTDHFDFFESIFSSRILSDDLTGFEVHVYSRISDPEDNIVESHEKSGK